MPLFSIFKTASKDRVHASGECCASGATGDHKEVSLRACHGHGEKDLVLPDVPGACAVVEHGDFTPRGAHNDGGGGQYLPFLPPGMIELIHDRDIGRFGQCR
jgi:hypothetical protein